VLPIRKNQLKRSTFSSYRGNIRNHVAPRIGPIQLQKLTAEDLDRFYADLLENGRLNGRGGPLSSKTVRSIHAMLHKALADACRKGTLQRNVADLADPPRVRISRGKGMKVWDAEQLRQFLTEIDHHRLAPAYFVAANTGMRRGEVLGLRWADVDLDTARLSVHEAVLNVEYELDVDSVKSESGRRSIDIDPRTVAVLRSWRTAQREESLALGLRAAEHDHVFARPDGSPLHPDYFSQVFERHVARSELPTIRLHDLRHTHATILLEIGVNLKIVSERLGHSNPAFTMTVYQHVLPGMQSDAARAFGEAVFGE